MRIRDLKGQKFNRLEVIELLGERRDGQAVWKCKCECDNYVNVKGIDLTTNEVKSCGCLKKEQDHINLREKFEEQYINGVNASLLKSKIRKDNTSGVKGVSYHRASGKWDASIGVKGKQIHLGRFWDINDAIEARKKAEIKYHKPILLEDKERKK